MRLRRVAAITAALLSLLVVTGCDTGVETTTFTLARGHRIFEIIEGPDGAEWATGGRAIPGRHPQLCIYRIVGTKPLKPTACAGKKVRVPTGVSTNLTVADGALWAVGNSSDGLDVSIVRFSMDGETQTFPIDGNEVSSAAMFAGPDGRLWYVGRALREIDASGVDRLLVADKGGSLGLADARFGATSADGTVYLQTLFDFLEIDRDLNATHVNLAPFCTGREIEEEGTCYPQHLTLGPDDNVWFVDTDSVRGDRVGQIVKDRPIKTIRFDRLDGEGTIDIAAGPSGAIWAARGGQRLARITPEGAVSYVRLPSELANITTSAVAAGTNGTLWLAARDQAIRVEPPK